MTRIAYLRVSTKAQAEGGDGLDAQREATSPADRVYQDVCSGTTPIQDRPGLLAALGALGKGDELVVARRDRLGRDLVLVAILERMVEDRGARIVSAAGEGSDLDGPSGTLIRTILDAVAQYERALIALRTSAALAARRRAGKRYTQDVYGFRVNAEGGLDPIPREQEALGKMREYRTEGFSYRFIADYLNRWAYKPKRGRKWHASSVRSVLLTAEKHNGTEG